MKPYAIILNNFIQSVFMWDGITPYSFIPPDNARIMLYDDAILQGYGFNQNILHVPEEIESYQLREWLIKAGHKSTVEQIINSIPDQLEKEIALNRWEYATKVPRHNIIVLKVAEVLGMSSSDIDQAFIEAKQM